MKRYNKIKNYVKLKTYFGEIVTPLGVAMVDIS